MSTRKDQLLRRAAGKKGRPVAITREEKALRTFLEQAEQGHAQPDLSQNDRDAADYVKGRTHYRGLECSEYVDYLSVNPKEVGIGVYPLVLSKGLSTFHLDDLLAFEYMKKKYVEHGTLGAYDKEVFISFDSFISVIGKKTSSKLDVIKNAEFIDDSNYKCIVNEMFGLEVYIICNLNSLTEEYANMFTEFGVYLVVTKDPSTISMGYVDYLSFDIVEYVPIPASYVPNSTPNVKTAEVGQMVVVKEVNVSGVPVEWEAVDLPDVEAAQNAAKNAQTTADSKMNATDPVGTGSFSMNRDIYRPLGKNACVIGKNNVAMHLSESVFGQYNAPDPTIDDITWEKSEQETTYVPAADSAVTAYVTSLDDVVYNAARGLFSLKNATEVAASNLPTDVYILYPGVTSSSRVGEKPKLITTNQKWSSGSRRLWYDLYEPVVTVGENAGAYLHSIGNGTANNKRSNAHTLDWAGNAWYAGDVYVGSTSGTDKDEGSKKLVANGDTEIILASSTADSTKKFKITVDDSGTLTATEVTE